MCSERVLPAALLLALVDYSTIWTDYLNIYIQESTLCYFKCEACKYKYLDRETCIDNF